MSEPAADRSPPELTDEEDSGLFDMLVVRPLIAIRTSVTLFIAVFGASLFLLGFLLAVSGVLAYSPTTAILGVLGVTFIVFAILVKAFFVALGYS
jgi:hypothetical protein